MGSGIRESSLFVLEATNYGRMEPEIVAMPTEDYDLRSPLSDENTIYPG